MGSLFNLQQFDGLRKGELSTYARARFNDLIQNPVRLGERIMPFRDVEDWEVEVGQVSFRNIAAAIIAPDSLIPRGPLGTESAKRYSVLKGGLKYTLNESELRKLRDVFRPGSRIDPPTLLRSGPYQLANSLVNAFLDRAEQMRWEILTTGEYAIPGSGGVKVAFGIPNNNKIALTSTDVWSDYSNADGLDDLLDWDALIFDELGVHSERTFMSTASMTKLLAQDKTKTKLANAGYAGIGGMVTGNTNQLGMAFFMDAVNAYLARYGIGPITLYDRKYNSFSFTGATQPALTRYLDEDSFVMVAPSPLDGGTGPDIGTAVGYTANGPVVENDFQPGLHVWYTENDEPVEVAVKSAFWALPIIGDPRTIVCGTLD